MPHYEIRSLRDHPEGKQAAARWFHAKWGIALPAYLDSMDRCTPSSGAVPEWYVAVEGGEIIAGVGVIDNDFHARKDLTPNVCALFVEKRCRNRGIAGALLERVCRDMSGWGIDTLYLLTDHTTFYERYGWEFLCMVQGEGEPAPSRMYVHFTKGE